jgi:hypothetical protein
MTSKNFVRFEKPRIGQSSVRYQEIGAAHLGNEDAPRRRPMFIDLPDPPKPIVKVARAKPAKSKRKKKAEAA